MQSVANSLSLKTRCRALLITEFVDVPGTTGHAEFLMRLYSLSCQTDMTDGLSLKENFLSVYFHEMCFLVVAINFVVSQRMRHVPR